MSTTHLPSTRMAIKRSLIALTFGVSVWFIISSAPMASDNHALSESAAAKCQTAADVMASLDRSRNGVSLTCNGGTLIEARAR